MTAAPTHNRASALHRRAMDGVAEAAGDDDPPDSTGSPARRPAPTLPGAGVLLIALVGLALGLAATAVVLGRA